MTIVDTLEQAWTSLLQIMSQFVIPDWNAIIGLLPLLVFIGLVGPLLTFIPLGVLIYQFRKPRVKVGIVEGPRVATMGADGEPTFPPGLPHCRRDALIYPTGTIRCDVCHDDLAVTCPMCGLGRPALIDTCTNCGLVLNVKRRPATIRPASGPRPGGAAVA